MLLGLFLKSVFPDWKSQRQSFSGVLAKPGVTLEKSAVKTKSSTSNIFL